MTLKLLQGNNRLRLCPATMQAVVQAWLNEELASPVEVTGVSYEGGNSMFEVTFKRVEGASE